jgi:hypothetical protein
MNKIHHNRKNTGTLCKAKYLNSDQLDAEIRSGSLLIFNNNTIDMEIVKQYYGHLYIRLCRGCVGFRMIESSFNVVDPCTFIVNAYRNPSRQSQAMMSDSIYIKEIIDRQIEFIRVQKSPDYCEIQWIIENTMSQLTSSINPIIEDDEIWYGYFYKPPVAGA